MNSRTTIPVIGLVITALLVGCQRVQKSPVEAAKIYSVELPPKSLDQYYPPQSEEPLFLYAMHSIEGPLGGLMTSMMEGKVNKAQKYFESFKTEYEKVSKMVPEWINYFPTAPIEELGEAIESKDGEKIQKSMEHLGGVCSRCHEENRIAVWYKYHWKDFGQVTIEDPVTGDSISWMGYMFAISGSFSSVATYISEKRFDEAQVALKGFNSRLEKLKTGCKSCHEAERLYFVSSDIEELLSKAIKGLEAKEPDVGKVFGYLQMVGMESCHKCHLVHIPAATIHRAWAVEQGSGKGG